MKILIADDHTIVREGLKYIISDIPDVKFVDEASDGFEVIEKVNNNKYDLVIMDITMPGKNGLDTLKELKQINNKLPVLMLSVHNEEQYGFRVLKAGAAGFIPKHSEPEEFQKAIYKAVAGKKYLSDNLINQLANNLDDGSNKPLHQKLSDREFQVFKLIAEGKAIKDISEELFLSNKTISTYRTRILEKMNMQSNADIVKYAVEFDIIS